MTVERAPRPIRLPLGVNVQHDPRDLVPVRAVRIGIKDAQIGDQMLFVVPRERWIGGRQIGDIGAACIQAEVAIAMEYQPKYDFTFACGGPSFGFPRRLPGPEGHLWPHRRSYRSSVTMRQSALR
jgi:hypothetical protein